MASPRELAVAVRVSVPFRKWATAVTLAPLAVVTSMYSILRSLGRLVLTLAWTRSGGGRATVAAVVVAADADGAMSIPAISTGAPTARNAPPSFLFIAIILSPPTSITLFRVHLNAV